MEKYFFAKKKTPKILIFQTIMRSSSWQIPQRSGSRRHTLSIESVRNSLIAGAGRSPCIYIYIYIYIYTDR